MTELEKNYTEKLIYRWYKNRVINFADFNIMIIDLRDNKRTKFSQYLSKVIAFYQIPYNKLPIFCKTHYFKNKLKKLNYQFSNESINYDEYKTKYESTTEKTV